MMGKDVEVPCRCRGGRSINLGEVGEGERRPRTEQVPQVLEILHVSVYKDQKFRLLKFRSAAYV